MHRIVLSGNEEIAVRLGAALILGGMLGLNRELHGKPAGLRTHALVSLGAGRRNYCCAQIPERFFSN
jgi:uncharacterized membrane protein YhiD involved in acid resistance